MARVLSSTLDAITLRGERRSPTVQVVIYDLRSGGDTINEVAIFNRLETGSFAFLSGPRDFTADVFALTFEEQRGDYVGGGIQASALTLDITDPEGLFDPLLITGIPTTDPTYPNLLGRFLRAGNAVVVRAGDEQVDSAEWAFIFTGEIVGQAGVRRSRSDGADSVISVRALSREAGFLKFTRTSTTYSQGQTYLAIGQLVAEEEMGLDINEVNLTGWGSTLLAHKTLQFVEETPLAMLAKLMFVDGFLPRFDGAGILTQISSVTTALPIRVYGDFDLIRKLDRPFSDLEAPNSVKVVGLDADLSKVVQSEQLLAETRITTGFFANGEDFNVYWSDDRTMVAQNTTERVRLSVNGGMSILGGGESFTFIASPGPGGGFVGVKVTVDTGYAPWLIVFLTVAYIALAAVPDEVLTVGFAVGGGITINIGSIAAAVALSAALYVMSKIANGQYEFMGEPIEWCYKEISGRAFVEGTGEFDRSEVVIENHLVSSVTAARNAATAQLLLLQAQENPRALEMVQDLRLEPSDIFEIPGGRRFMVQSISYRFARETTNVAISAVAAFEVTPGVVA